MTDGYLLDRDPETAAPRLDALAELLDPYTTDRIGQLMDVRGRRCLEVGAGSGSIARWLAGRVGRAGEVLATDLVPRFTAPPGPLSVIAHDLTAEPVPDGPWHLIHARLVLAHLPERERVLARLVDALAPGGVILIEEWDASRTDTVMVAPTERDAGVYRRFQRTLGERVFSAGGTDRGWARRVHAELLRLGLTEVDTQFWACNWSGGDPGCRQHALTLEQTRPRLRAAGLTEPELTLVRGLLSDPRLVLSGHLMYSTAGYRPFG